MNNVRCVWAVPFVVALVCLVGASPALAQGTTGTLTGTVVDASGSAVPGATVTATEAATTAVRTVVSNENGLFRIAGLDPGRYTVKVELTSFKPISIADVALSAAEVRDLGKVKLEVGALTETLTVTSEVTPVQVADSARRKTVTGDDLQNIQMKGRDIYNLLAVLPGVQDTNLNRDYSSWTSATQITINGAPSQNKDVRIDGINIVDEGGCGTAFVNLNMDAVNEIQVVSNGYTAENGRNNGGLINVVTKSGSNVFKGSAWYNGRRDQFNAIDYFRQVNKQVKPLYDVNISGYGFGGPLVIPGVMDARKMQKKTFFYVSQEYTSDKRPTSTTRVNLPTALERVGDFSQTKITNGTIQPIIDPQTGQQFPGNIIPTNRINSLGQKMLNLLPQPNGILNLQAGQEFTSNSAYDTTPEHGRTNNVIRVDQVFTAATRASFRLLKDRDDTWSYNNFTPGTGHVNNNVPGIVASGTVTQVLKPTMVNEMNFGYTHNRWGFRAGPETSVGSDFDYTQLYASALGINPPRLLPFGDHSDPPALSGFGGAQVDEWPYAPRFSTSGGNRSNLAGYMTANGNLPLPRLNMSARGSWADDLSITKGRHSLKAGAYLEFNHKTEPGSADYVGNYDFGNNANNPLNTGNGYANMLLGAFNTYTELTDRVDKAVRHWQNDFYIQDNWRATPRFTLDYGVRFQHSGSDYEVNNNHTGFYTDKWNAGQAARVYKLVCTSGVPGDQACPTASQKAIDPANPNVLLSTAFNGNIVPGSGNFINGVSTDGIPGAKPGTYFKFPYFVAAPRVGMAWNVTGDGKTAIRASTGIFYNFPRSTGTGGYSFAGGCPVSCSNQLRWATFDDIAAFASGSSTVQLVQTPVNVNVGDFDQPLAKSYNVNVAFQRDIGFNTVAEVAYVGNFAYEGGRTVDVNRLPLYVYGNSSNLVNNTPLNNNSLRQFYGKFPGMGSVSQFVPDLYTNSLQYNAMQLNVQRRLSHGLQTGFAYTLASANGYCAQGCSATVNPGYDPYTDQIGGKAALKARYWGPTAESRKHNMIVNYSYDIPTFTQQGFVKQLVRDWQVSGVTRLLSGAPITPTCSSNNAGIQNTNPSLTDGITSRCQMVGDPFTLTADQIAANKNLPFADQVHFNVAAFAMAQPNGNVGNFGNTPVGILRQPTWHEWDVTLARRFPVGLMGRKNSGIKLQLQAFNVFNEVQFTNMNASYTFTGANNSQNSNANTGKYTPTGDGLAAGTIAPRTMGLTVRFDW
jgi:outer membrane receptor protein involved in Fe transport